MKRINTVLLGLGLVFLLCLVWKTGWRELWQQVGALGWGIMLIIMAEGLANLAHTVGWRQCIRARGSHIPFWALFRMNMAGWAINYLTPTASVGGEVSRAALLASSDNGANATSSVLVDKLMTAIAHLLLVVLGAVFLFWRVRLPLQLWIAMAVTTALLTAGMTIYLWLQKNGRLGAVCRWLVQRNLGGGFVSEIEGNLSRVDGALKDFYSEHPLGLVLSVIWHLIGHSAALLQVWLFLYLSGQPVSVVAVTAAGCLALWFDLLTFAIPMNVGTLEGSRIMVLGTLGCQALVGMTFGVAVRIAQLFWACFGLASYVLLTTAESARLVAAKENHAPQTAVGGPNFVTEPRKTLSKQFCYLEDKQ